MPNVLNKMEEITLRVAGNTNPNDLRMAILGHLRAGKKILVDALGEKANYRALKSVVGAEAEGAKKGLKVNYNVVQIDVAPVTATFGNESIMLTAFRWILTAEEKQSGKSLP